MLDLNYILSFLRDKLGYFIAFIIGIAIWELLKKTSKSAVSFVIHKTSSKTALIIISLLIAIFLLIWFRW